MEYQDAALLKRWAANRDAEAFNAIVSRYSDLVYATCKRVLGNASQAEDATQECFIRLADTSPAIRSSLGAWLHRVATNQSLNMIKAESRRRAREQRFAKDAQASTEPDWSDIQDLVDEAIEHLPEKLRCVVVAHFLERRTHDAIAQELGVTRQAVSYRIHKGVGLVRGALKKRGVSLTAAALTGMFGSQLAESAPPALAAALGKLAVAGTGAAGRATGAATGAALVKKLAIAAVALSVLLLGSFMARNAMDRETAAAPPSSVKAALSTQAPGDTASDLLLATDMAGEASGSPDTILDPEPASLDAGLRDTPTRGGNVTGRVYDAESGQGIEGVRVRAYLDAGEHLAEERGDSASSGGDGVYGITGLEEGRYIVVPDGPLHMAHNSTRLSDGRYSRDLPTARGYPSQDWRNVARTVSIREGTQVHGVDMPFEKACLRVSGIVISADGEPVKSALVGMQTERMNNGRQTRSQSDGRFELILDTAASALFAVARSDEAESPVLGPVELPEGGVSGLELRLSRPRAASIAGTVADRFDDPVPGVSVFLSRGRPTDLLGFQGTDRTTSGKDGTFSFDGLVAGGYGIVTTFQNTPWLPYRREVAETVNVAKGEKLTGLRVVCHEAEGLVIRGRVVDGVGKPVKKAMVDCQGPQTTKTVYSEDDGRFLLAGLQDGDYRVTAQTVGYTQTILEGIPAGSEGIEIVLRGMGSVEGRVLRADTGAPVKDFEVSHIRAHGDLTRFKPGMLLNSRRFSDPDGRFALEGVQVGGVTVTAKAKGLAPAFRVVYAEEGQVVRGVDLFLEPGERVEGIVVDSAGAPISGADIFMGPVPPDGLEHRGLAGQSDAEGRFVVEDLSPDIRRLSAKHPLRGSASAEVSPTMRIVLADTGTVEGVVTINGEPFPEATVAALSLGTPRRPHKAKTGIDGSYALTNVPLGRVSVMLGPQGQWVGAKQAVVEAGQVTRVDIELTAGTAVIEGRITLGGEAADRASVTASTGETHARHANASSEGYYRLDRVPAGQITLQAGVATANQQFFHQTLELIVAEGETIHQDIDIERPSAEGKIVGRVLVAAGMEKSNSLVSVYEGHLALPEIVGMEQIRAARMQWGRHVCMARCGEDGTFELQGIEQGDYTVGALIMPVADDGQTDPGSAVFLTAEITVVDGTPVPVEFDLR